EVRKLVAEFADCFALLLSKVNVVPGAVHKLDIKEGANFSTKPNQRKMTPVQKEFLDKKLDEMLEAGIIRPINPSKVKCSAPVVLVPKPNNTDLPLAELQHMVNNECIAHGLEPVVELLP
ncbi:hypothetical protein FA15DRAFT_606227, partial [Coprinopsis marcescibilis]